MDGATAFCSTIYSIWIFLPLVFSGNVHWEMSRICGATIALDNWFGEVTCDPSMATSDFTKNYCTLYITPKKLDPGQTNQVLLYFTEFDVGDDCNRGGLTVYDTSARNLVAYSRAGMCGRNATLTNGEHVFIVQHGTIILNYTWTTGLFDRHSHDFYSTFTLRFNSFFENADVCKGEDRHQCSNARCVHEESYCRTDMNGCGYTAADQCQRDAEATAVAAEDDILTTIWNEIKKYIWLIILGFIVYWFLTCMRNPQSIIRRTTIGQKIHERLCCEKNLPPARDPDFTSDNNGQADANVRETELTDHEDAETSSWMAREHDVTQRSDSPTRSIYLTMDDGSDFPANAHPSAPPPSYDEVTAPSYDHYMANQDMYKDKESKS